MRFLDTCGDTTGSELTMPLTTDYSRVWRRRRPRYVYENKPPAQQQTIATTRSALVFDQTNVKRDGVKPTGYGLLFCVHGRLLTQVCDARTCRRDRREARRNAGREYAVLRALVLQEWEVT